MTTHTIGWTLKNVIAPIFPFFMGAFLRYIMCQEFSLLLFDQEGLALSMSFMCFIVLHSVNKIDDENLRVSLIWAVFCLLLTFLCLYASSIILKSLDPKEFTDRLLFLSKIIIAITLFSIPAILICKHKYKLD